MIQLKMNPTDRVIELGGGSHPLVRPNVDVRICHDTQGNQTVDFPADFHHPLPIQSDEWDGVFSQFAIEHIAYPKVPQFIAEIYRILKPGGKAVIVTANTEAQLKWALEHPEGWDGKDMFESASCKLFGDQRHGEREGDANPGHDSHKCYFSPAILTKLFQDAGFEQVHLTPYGARNTDIVVEALKPREERKLDYRVIEGGTEIPKPQGGLYSKEESAPYPGDEPVFNKEGMPSRVIEAEMREIPPHVQKAISDNLQRGRPTPVHAEPVTLSAEGAEILRKKGWLQEEGEPTRGDNAPAGYGTAMTTPYPPYAPGQLFDRTYFNGGVYKPFYWDFPAHEITARHVLSRKPESVLELGCARGYVLKRLQDAGLRALGLEVSKHCYMTRAADRVHLWDISKTPWDTLGPGSHDLCFSIAVLDHIPEEFLPAIFAEMERTCKRGLHGIDFRPAGDETQVTIHPKEWWQLRLPRGHEVVDKNELEGGPFPEDAFRGDGKIKLNIGSAMTMFHHGWTNIDVFDYGQWAQGHGYQYQRLDIRNGIPWGTGDVSLIYCGHMLEHLSYKEGLTFLRDCRRVMKPDGAMRLIVPDADQLISAFGETKYPGLVPYSGEVLHAFDEVNEGCANAPTAAGKLWALLLEGHQAVYDAETLVGMLEQAGFRAFRSEFRKQPFSATPQDESRKQILRETLDTHPALSLYVDAIPKVG